MRKSLLSLAALTLFSSNALSQEETTLTTIYDPTDWSYNIGLASMSFDSDTALGEGVDDSAITVTFGANYRAAGWLTSIDADAILYDDNNEFSQVVVGDGLFNRGDVSTASSEASAFALSLASGYEWRFAQSERASAILQGGFSAVFVSDRSIADCVDCDSQDIDIDGGAFIAGKLAYNFEKFSLGLNVRQYVSGDGLSNMFGIIVDTEF